MSILDWMEPFVKRWVTLGNVMIVCSVGYLLMLAFFLLAGIKEETDSRRRTRQWLENFLWFFFTSLVVYLTMRYLMFAFPEGQVPVFLMSQGFGEWKLFFVVFGILGLATYFVAIIDDVMNRSVPRSR